MRARPRGAKPPELDKKKNGRTELERATDHFDTQGKVDGFEFEVYSDKAVKTALELMYLGKCAYCEELYDASAPQDVEHYRPKGRIDTPTGKLQPGYWWLAADWDNLLPSCIHCNREQNQTLFDGSELKTGKGDRFPIDDDTKRGRKPGKEPEETPLLLNPCEDDPTEFIRFADKAGDCIVQPVSNDAASLEARRARTSIDVYGLNRAGLVRDRSRYMLRIKTSLRMIEILAGQIEGASPGELPVLEELLALEMKQIRSFTDGQDRFSGMALTFVEPLFARLGLKL